MRKRNEWRSGNGDGLGVLKWSELATSSTCRPFLVEEKNEYSETYAEDEHLSLYVGIG